MTVGIATALIALGGVLGAAIVAAIAAVFGPSLLHRLQHRAKISDQAAERAATNREAEIRRLVEFRTTGRAWFDFLDRAATDFDSGRALSLEAFDELLSPYQDGAAKAVYEMAHDDHWIQSAPIGDTATIRALAAAKPSIDEQANRAKSEVLNALRHATKLLRDDVRADRPTDSERVSRDTWDAISNVRRARIDLNSTLLLLLDRMTTAPAALPSAHESQ